MEVAQIKVRWFRRKPIIFVIASLVGVALFTKPLMNLILQKGGIAYWTKLEPQKCHEIAEYLKNLSSEEGKATANSLLESLKSSSEMDSILKCRLDLLSVLKADPISYLELFKLKTKDFEYEIREEFKPWKLTLNSLCKENGQCAERLIFLALDPLHSKQQSFLNHLILETGEAGRTQIFEHLNALNNLGFHSDDTDAQVDDSAQFLVQIYISDPALTWQKLAPILLDDRYKSQIRFRLAHQYAQIKAPGHEAMPLLLLALSRRETQLNTRIEILKSFSALASTSQELISELSRALAAIEVKIINSQPWTTEDHKLVLETLASYRKVAAKIQPKYSLDEVIPGLVEATSKLWGNQSSQTKEIIEALRDYPLLKSSLSALLMQSQGTVSIGLKGLTNSEKVTSTQWTKARVSIETLKLADRYNLLNQIKNDEAKGIVFSTLTATEQRRALSQNSKQKNLYFKFLRDLAARDDFDASLKIEVMVALNRIQRNPAIISRVDRIILNQFSCSPSWLVTAHHIIESGPQTPGFGSSVVQIMSCPQEQLDSQLISKNVFNRDSFKQIQKVLKMRHHATPQQLQRLTDILSQSNRVPGSSLPPKIRK